MKGTNLKFNQVPRFAAKIQSRRLGTRNFITTAYAEDGGEGGEGDDAESKKLLDAIQQRMAKLLEDGKYQNREAVDALFNEQLKGLNLEALRAYETEKTKLEDSVKKIAGELQKVQNRSIVPGEKPNGIKIALEKSMEGVERVMRSKGDNKEEIRFNVRAAAVMTTDNTIDETAVPDDLIESFSMAEFVPKRYGTQFIGEIADRITVAQVAQYKTWLEEGDIEGAFAIVAEGGLKPLVSADLVRNVSNVRKIAGKYVVTEEFAKFRKEAYRIIRQIIQDKMYRDYDAILTADLNTAAASYTGTILDGTITDPNDYDAIGAVAAQIEALNFTPDVLILNPQDKWRIRLQKDNEGRYLFPVVTESGTTIMLGLRLVTSTYQTAGTFTLGESGLYKIEEESVTVRMGYGVTVTGSNPVTNVVSDFDNNQFRVIVETFFHNYLATNHIGSFVTASFATVKAALAAA